MQKGVTKEMYYTALIQSQILVMFNEDEECVHHIDLEELSEGNNATCFVHALSCAAAMVYQRITGEKCDFLGFNHVANRLVHQFANKRR